MAMMGSSRSLPGSASCPRMAANIVFQPLVKLGLCKSIRSRLRSFPPRRARIASIRSGGPALASSMYGMPVLDTVFAWEGEESSAAIRRTVVIALLSHNPHDAILLGPAFAAPVAIAGRDPQLARRSHRNLAEPAELLPEVDLVHRDVTALQHQAVQVLGRERGDQHVPAKLG